MKKKAFYVSSSYFFLGITWIFTGDKLLASMNLAPNVLTFYQSVKGVIYVAVTAISLFYLIRRYGNTPKEKHIDVDSLSDLPSNYPNGAADNHITNTKDELEDILSHIRDMVWRINVKESRLEYISPACLKILGYSPDEFYSHKSFLKDMPHPDDMKYLRQRTKELETKEEIVVECRVIRKDGSVGYLLNHFKATKDEQGIPIIINGISSDITAEKEANQQAKIAADIKAEILENCTDGFCAVDKNWNFTYINKEFEHIIRMQRQDLLGKNVWACFPNAVNQKFYTESHRAVRENVRVNYEEYSTSTRLWLKVSAYPTQDGLAIYFQDVTKEKELWMAADRSKKNLYALINNTKDLIWSVNTDLRLVTANQLYKDFVKQQTGILLHRGDKVTPLSVEKEEADKWETYYRRGLRGESFHVEEQFPDDEGSVQYGEIGFNPINTDAGIVGVSCLAHDITAIKLNETRITKQNQLLKEIAYIQSHKLRRPVATIMGLVALIDTENLSAAFNVEIVHKLKEVCQELDDIIHEIVEKTIELE